MIKNLRHRFAAGVAAFAIVLANVMLPAMPVFADHGNNGTLKVHEKGTPSGTESNDPKVCTFNFEGFGFDDYMSGYIVIAGQGQTNGSYGPYAFGPTNSNGYAQTSYFNNGVGSITIPNGHYKATLYGKKNGDINYRDDKAKSKVFKVDCAAPVKDAAASVDVTDPTCKSAGVASIVGLANASLTSNSGVLNQTVGMHTAVFTATAGHLFANGQATKSVNYVIAAQLTGGQCEEKPQDDRETRVVTDQPVCEPLGHGTVTSYTEERTRSYSLVNNVWTPGAWSEWTKVEGSTTTRPATTEECPPIIVSTVAPEKYDFCYNDEDRIWISYTDGVIYKVNGEEIESSYVPYEGVDLIVTAEPAEGYAFAEGATTSWTFTAEDFTNEQCLTITKSAKVAKDTNLDGKIGVGDTVVWNITVTNNSESDYSEGFYVKVDDEGVVYLEDDGYIGYLGAGDSEVLKAKSIITDAQMRACKVTNTATFSADRAFDYPEYYTDFSIMDAKKEYEPLATGTASAEYVLDCPTPGRGGETPKTPETPIIPVLPNTSGISTQVVGLGALSFAGIMLAAGIVIKSRLLA